MTTTALFHTVVDVLFIDIYVIGILDSIANCSWLDEEPYKTAIPPNDVSFKDEQMTIHFWLIHIHL